MASFHLHPYEEISAEHNHAARRLSAQMTKMCLDPPDLATLRQAIYDCIHHRHFAYADELLSTQPNTWYVISIEPSVTDLGQRNDPHLTAPDLETAIACVLHEFDSARVLTIRVDVQDDGIDFYVDRGLAVQIKRMQFSEVSTQQRDRVDKTITGLRAEGDGARWRVRLSRLPGLASLNSDTPQVSENQSGPYVHKNTANLCNTTRTFLLERFGIPTKLSQAQELTAALFGAESWQHLIARADEVRCWEQPTILTTCLEPGKLYDSPVGVRFYRGPAESIWAFGEAVQQWVGPPLSLSFDVRPVLTGGVVFSASIRVDHPKRPPDWPTMISTYTPQVAMCEGRYRILAGDLPSGRAALRDALEEVLGVSGSGGKCVADATARIKPEGVLEIRDWVFMLFDRHGYLDMVVLSAERFDAQGKCVRRFSVLPYKTHIQRNVHGEVEIEMESETHVLDGVAVDDAHRLAAFAKLDDWCQLE